MENDMQRGRTRSAYQAIKQMKRKFVPRTATLKDDQGVLIMDGDSRKNRWKQYTEQLYKKEDSCKFEPLENYEEEPDILQDEVISAVKELEKHKAPGIDNIPIEAIQASPATIEAITKLCQKIWRTKTWPKEWKRSIYIPLHKKGDPSDCSNYRTIALIPHASKVLLKIIQRRLESHVDRELPENQAGFRKGRGTRDVIADVRWMLEKTREYQKDVYMCFIDYSKAFDSVDYDKLWTTLRGMAIPEHLIVLMRNLYSGQEAAIRTEDGNSGWFTVSKGVRQGCILSPYLFNLYAEEIMRNAELYDEEAGIRIGGRTINNLRYADDTTIH